MKKNRLLFPLLFTVGVLILSSCSTMVEMTSWKNPDNKAQISNVVVMPLFEKLEYLKPFEQSMTHYFESRGLPATGSLEFLNPTVKYPINEIKHRCDSVGADAILLFIYKGTDKTESYIPPTTYYTGGYGGYGGYWGGGYWGGYYNGYYGDYVTTGGYWTSTSVVSLTAKLYVKGSQDPIWTGEINVTDPEYIDMAANFIAQKIYSDWQFVGLLKPKSK